MIDPRLRRDIQGAESCRLTAYRDPRGLWTIGWGHLLDQHRDWTGVTWTQAQADAQLDTDIELAEALCDRLPELAELNDCRTNAVSELVFNMGLAHWLDFKKCRQALKTESWQVAHDELLSSTWSHQVHEHRANRIAGYILTGAYL